MKLFSAVLFIHILAAVVWLGAGITLDLLRHNVAKTKDKNKIKDTVKKNVDLVNQVFAPAGITSLLSGILMVVISNRLEFSDLWITIALVGIFVAIIHGAFITSKQAKKLIETETKGKMFNDEYSSFVIASKTSIAIITVVLLDMVMKPTTANLVNYAIISAVIFVLILLTAKKQI